MPSDSIQYTTVNPYDQADQTAGQVKANRLAEHLVYILETQLAHATTGDGLVDKGQAVQAFAGLIPGVAEASAAATTDYVPVRLPWDPVVMLMSVTGADGSGNAAIAYGDVLYYDAGTLNVDSDNGTPWGILVGAAVTSGATATRSVLMLPAALAVN